jgi:iron-sulfur cluster repair protein YtfE (RIC family)
MATIRDPVGRPGDTGDAQMDGRDLSRVSGDDASRRGGLAVLHDDHRRVRDLCARLDGEGDSAEATAGQLCRELELHEHLESDVLYPAAERAGVAGDVLAQAHRAHHDLAGIVQEVATLTAGDDRFAAATRSLIGHARQHIEDEERTLFPILERALGAALVDLGAELESYRARLTTPESQ